MPQKKPAPQPQREDTLQRYNAFVDAYVADPQKNAAAAARAAGYSPTAAAQTAGQLLTIPYISDQIRIKSEEQGAKYGLTVNRVMQEYMSLAFTNIIDFTQVDEAGQRYVDLNAMTRDNAAAIAEIYVETTPASDGRPAVTKTKFKLHPKLPALEALAKYLQIPGIGTTKLEVTNPDGSLAGTPMLQVVFLTEEQERLLAESAHSKAPKLLEGEV